MRHTGASWQEGLGAGPSGAAIMRRWPGVLTLVAVATSCTAASNLHDLTAQPAQLSGYTEGGTVVFLLDEQRRPSRWTVADSLGFFRFEDLRSGRQELFLNDL